MAGSATITGRQNYVLGIGHPKNEAPTEGAPAVFATDFISGEVLGLIGPSGELISFAGPAYTFAGLPAASAGNAGMSARVTDVGPLGGSIWISTGTYWRPVNGSVMLAQASSSVATPLQTLSAAGKFTLPTDSMVTGGSLVIPSNLLRVGSTLRISAKVKHRGTAGTWSLAPRMGTLNTSSDSNVAFISGTAVNNQDLWLFSEMHVTASGSFQSDGFATPNSTTVGAFTDKNSNINIASTQYLGLYAAAIAAGDFLDLLQYRVELIG